MRLTGNVSYRDDRYGGTVREAVLTTRKVAIDWDEDGVAWHLVATPANGGAYRGNYGKGRLNPDCEVELREFKARNGAVLMMGPWHDRVSGSGGVMVFHLHPAETKRKSQTTSRR